MNFKKYLTVALCLSLGLANVFAEEVKVNENEEAVVKQAAEKLGVTTEQLEEAAAVVAQEVSGGDQSFLEENKGAIEAIVVAVILTAAGLTPGIIGKCQGRRFCDNYVAGAKATKNGVVTATTATINAAKATGRWAKKLVSWKKVSAKTEEAPVQESVKTEEAPVQESATTGADSETKTDASAITDASVVQEPKTGVEVPPVA